MQLLHTNVYSEYSLMQSTNRMNELVKRAKQLGYEAIALTDHHHMYGVIPFYQACLKQNIQPIIGLEITVKSNDQAIPFLLRLLAKSFKGYQSLVKLATILGLKDKKDSYIMMPDLYRYVEECFVIIPYYDGPLGSLHENEDRHVAVQWLKTNLPSSFIQEENILLEISGQTEQDRLLHERIISLEQLGKWRAIVGWPVRFLHQDDVSGAIVLKGIDAGTPFQRIETPRYFKHAYLPELDQFHQQVPYLAAYEVMAEVISQCQIHLPLEETKMPKYPLKEDEAPHTFLTQLCEEGLKKRYINPSVEANERLAYELSVIHKMGFTDYFLVVWDFIRYAKEQGIMVGPGRGSAASSIVAYTLSITEIDPLKYELLFERFLNPQRQSFPDIDVDFPDHRRDEVIEYVQKKYGKNHVAQILTFGTFAARAALRDVGKVLGIHAFEIDRAAKMVPSRPGITITKALEQSTDLHDLFQQSDKHKQWLYLVEKIEGLPRHTSTHAAGVIISQQRLTELIPLQAGQQDIYLAQATMNVLEESGFVKFDFLGLRNLTMLERIVKAIKVFEGKNIDLLQLPLDDTDVFKGLAAGKTTGVFQLESDGMRQVLTQLQPNRFEDIVAVNALYRPGPMDFIPTYIKGKHHPNEKIDYLHPDLEPILAPTYGVIVYQEQIIQIAVQLAGYSYAEADILRRAISKKKKETMLAEKQHFIEGALESGYEVQVAKAIFDLIERFANYGFPKSHAVAYSMISYQLSYLKVHYRSAFYAALFSGSTHHKEKLAEYIQEAKREGVEIYPPSLKKGSVLFSLEKAGIRIGLLSIEHVGYQAAKYLVELDDKSNIRDLFDLVVKVDHKIINKKVVEGLIKTGALDEFQKDRAILLANVDHAFDYGSKVQDFEAEMEGLFTLSLEKPDYFMQEPLTPIEKLEYEQEALGFYLSGHPVLQYEEHFHHYRRLTIEEMKKASNSVCRLAVLIMSVKQIKTKKGEPMAFVEVSDESNQISAVVFPSIWKQHYELIQPGNLIFVEGKRDQSRQNEQFIMNKVMMLESLQKS
ncbi:DNA polymerase III subunit alpha [Alkalihalobacillus pseudalcaliphilus]|uniref:DNA polymerase III subunit alpha n=1 Tax=Alkalihalobacillus pseudalcaliphilus TaxID=79884 RepID=UPI00069F6AFB|nr:DNA polymerase III subunit alpha [Alkalihalobacillus pseudalcaliphilus]